MAIKVSGTEVISNARALKNVASIDATTAAAITAGGVGGGGEIDLVANETLAAGTLVGTRTDNGRIEAIAGTRGDGTDIFSNFPIPLNSGQTVKSTAYDFYTGKLAVTISNNQSPDYQLRLLCGYYNGSTVVWGSQITLDTDDAWGAGFATVAVNPSGVFGVVYYNIYGAPTTTFKFKAFTVNNSGTPSFGNQVTLYTVTSYYGIATKIYYDQTNNIFICHLVMSSNLDRVGFVSVSGTTSTLLTTSNQINASQQGTGTTLKVDEVNKYVYYWHSRTSIVRVSYNSGGATGESYSTGASTVQSNYHPSIGKFIAGTSNFYGPQNTKIIQFFPTFGSTYTSSEAASFTDFNWGNNNSGGVISSSNVFTYLGNANTTTFGKRYNIPTNAVISRNQAIIGPELMQGSVITEYPWLEGVYSFVDVSGFFHVWGLSNSSRFIGVTAESITSGSTGKVTVIGGVNASQSGLTAGDIYNINPQGGAVKKSLGGTYLAGTATSATSLLVRS